MIPKYTGRFDKLESELKETNTLVKKHEEDLFRIREDFFHTREDLFRIRTRDVKDTFRRGCWKVEDGRLRRRDKKVTKDQKRSHSNPENSLVHTFTVADAHEALRQMWAFEKQQLYEHIQDLPKEASEDQFLELVTSVSPKLLATMISSKHAALLYAAQLSDKFILIKFALRQHHNQIQTPLTEAYEKGGMGARGQIWLDPRERKFGGVLQTHPRRALPTGKSGGIREAKWEEWKRSESGVEWKCEPREVRSTIDCLPMVRNSIRPGSARPPPHFPNHRRGQQEPSHRKQIRCIGQDANSQTLPYNATSWASR
ncbi:MAG: hypothetical protein LQ343_002480 [Gyalolechia ehrenbergii]|nr:MAG: hypothetical protein LQ343_002480 [Gyalolechia ehrenbergii]